MYKQNHSIGWVVRIVGYSMLICTGTFLIPIALNVFSAIRGTQNWGEALALNSVVTVCVIGLLFVSFYNLWMYPNLSVSANGLSISSVFLHRTFRWDEVEGTERLSNRQLIILVRKTGTFYYLFYGFLWGKFNKSVILFRSDAEIVNRLEGEINSFVSLKSR